MTSSVVGHPLPARFRDVAAGTLAVHNAVVVAVSGGLDSVVLLHLLRFTDGLPTPRIVVAHLDHRMRPGSADDADFVRGLGAAWGVHMRVGCAGQDDETPDPPTSEAQARAVRYAFLERVRREEHAGLVLTAHTADDQAETVLLRIARGTGTRGLAGIAARREPGMWRPFLGFWRAELEAYARAARLAWREDPTNRELGYARNALRHVVLPELERRGAPGARSALVRLAEHAREDEAAWAAVLPGLLAGLELGAGPDGVSVSRRALLDLPRPLHARVVRAVVEQAGASLDDERTGAVVRFAAAGKSGTAVQLGGGLELRRDFDRLRVAGAAASDAPGSERPVSIPDAREGRAGALIGGRPYRVAWGRTAHEGFEDAAFPPAALAFPLAVRGWRDGDRVRMPYGTKKLKKLLAEQQVPRPSRGELPVLVDASGSVLWVPGVVASRDVASGPSADLFYVGIARERPG